MTDLYEKLKAEPFIIAGPCVIESRDMIMRLCEKLKEITERQKFTFVFKASFDKANRTSITSFRGPGLEEGLDILAEAKARFDVPVTTDIHEPSQAKRTGSVVDIVQIPAFLCRQTDLLISAADTGKIVNIKKAQFLSGVDMEYPVKKVEDSGNRKIMLTERGSMFGYNNLVVDYRNIIDMAALGYPVVMDATHSVQRPGGLAGKSGGDGRLAPQMAYAAAAVGTKGFFFEAHENPSEAKSDGPNMIPLKDFENVLKKLKRIMDAVKG
ncbi:3-deoxy-8-phosphooctulonate synthase [Geovibrio thiophilus]|uniref:3-deoxy-8-phosphooctulonate synthase n=1 Tax=Geovibrio thiophilus TaxID=139438 RepID=A0A410K1X7_9BACT|nr:3-deoxy-8-phosphooctulonate synthase [Geovibrio thiophilus]QAR34381.1 3-deoxy-8-phosphooctulonate synthase [Geovibrio thiophilus]